MSNTSFDKDMKVLLLDIAEGVDKAIEQGMKTAPKECKKRLKELSPKDTGEYSKGWRIKRHRRPKSAIVYNATNAHLTHLLEFGHVIKNKNGTYGRAPAHPHMKQAEEESVKLFVDTIESALDQEL